jgi:hypothetical protein
MHTVYKVPQQDCKCPFVANAMASKDEQEEGGAVYRNLQSGNITM